MQGAIMQLERDLVIKGEELYRSEASNTHHKRLASTALLLPNRVHFEDLQKVEEKAD